MEEEVKQGAPAWMVSFGDMMTLILTFFILLVSMSTEQQEGLVAKGVGSFLVALRSFGLPGVLDEYEEASIFANVRRRFNLPPEEDPERRDLHVDASSYELIKAKAARALAPHREFNQPAIAAFPPDSAELTPAAERYLGALAPTLRPARGQLLVLEGHASDADARFQGGDRWLAFSRARSVANYLIREHDFQAERVEARAWLTEMEPGGASARTVDARLITPSRLTR